MPRRKKTIGATEAVEAALCPIERELLPRKRESLVVMDDACRVVLRKVGTKSRVYIFPAERALMRDKVLTHNHPPVPCTYDPLTKQEIYTGNSLSLNDVALAAKADAREIRAVTKGVVGGKQVDVLYSMERGESGWPQPAMILEEAKAGLKLAEKLVEIDDRGGKFAYHCQQDAIAYHRMWQVVAPALGMRYTARVLKKG